MKTSRKLIAGFIGLATVAGLYTAYQSDWGQEHLANSSVSSNITKTYQATEEFAVNIWNSVETYFISN